MGFSSVVSKLSCMDMPEVSAKPPKSAEELLAALADHADAQGRYFADERLVARLFWEYDVDRHRLRQFLTDLEANGQIVVDYLPSSYGGTVPVLTIAHRHRFPRWRKRNYIPGSIRQAVYERDGHRCTSCGSTERLSLDHIHPYSKGGLDTVENLQAMCLPCNIRKGAKV